MKIVIYGSSEEAKKLLEMTKESLEKLGLSQFVELTASSDDKYKQDLMITKDPAFCIEEESLEFKDMIFEGEVPSVPELDNLIMSMIGGGEDSCSSDGCGGGCGGCGGGCC